MKLIDDKYKKFISELPLSMQQHIQDAVYFLSSDEEYYEELKSTNPDLYKTMISDLENHEQVTFINDITNISEIEADIIIFEGDLSTEKDIVFDNEKINIINGSLSCRNIIVDDAYLFVNGNVNCNVMYGASGNDKMTFISSGIKTKLIVEYGHYTLIETTIDAQSIIMFHNQIKSNKEVKAKIVYEDWDKKGKKLNQIILDSEGYFDEEKFVSEITNTANVNFLD